MTPARFIDLDTGTVHETSDGEFFDTLFGPSPKDRALEAQYLRSINDHWQSAKAESDAMVKRGNESALAFTIRRLGPIYAHEAWEREQRALWLRGAWEAPVIDERRAA